MADRKPLGSISWRSGGNHHQRRFARERGYPVPAVLGAGLQLQGSPGCIESVCRIGASPVPRFCIPSIRTATIPESLFGHLSLISIDGETRTNWEEALQALGHTSGDVLTLPPPARRSIRLEFLNGKPFVDAEVPVSMYGSNENHCDAPVGIDLGLFTTDTNGEISLVTTNSPLALSTGYYEQQRGGPTGTMFTLVPYLIVDADQNITVKRLWELPRYDYVVWIRESDNQPVAHAHFAACNNFDGCGEGCGPLSGAPESNVLGVIRFRHEDLREMRSLTLVNAGGQRRDLTDSEMNELFRTHQLHLVW
jgi:hypothetical protein